MTDKRIFAQTRDEAYDQVGAKREMILRWVYCRDCKEREGEEYMHPNDNGHCTRCRDNGGWYEEEKRVLH